MKFLAISLIVHPDDSATSTTDRLREVVDNAVFAEEIGFDSRPLERQP